MPPEKALPFSDAFSSPEDYVHALLEFTSTSTMFNMLCGGVHILDFFTTEPGLYYSTLPAEWHSFILDTEPMALLDLLMRDNLDTVDSNDGKSCPPDSLLQYIREVRRLSLRRSFARPKQALPVLPRRVAAGMKPKKMHEVTNFAGYVDRLARDVATMTGQEATHLIDFGSGQNYLGRTLASSPYNRDIVAVESKAANIDGARGLDAISGMAVKEKVIRNKKLLRQVMSQNLPLDKMDEEALQLVVDAPAMPAGMVADLRHPRELESTYVRADGKGFIQYVEGRLENGDLSHILPRIGDAYHPGQANDRLRLMAMSIHSCGNLSHHGIRSLVLNESVRAVAIVGCCYNLMTERLGPPTYKNSCLRPSLQALNGRVIREAAKHDPEGFPMSDRFCTHSGTGIRLNITARMMACQAPDNWTEAESAHFFDRHFYRAVLQKIFFDKGVVARVYYGSADDADEDGAKAEKPSPFNTSTNPVIIGSLRKACYTSFKSYVRGAIAKLTVHSEYTQYSQVIREKMGDITDEELEVYERGYAHRKRELSAIWSLMAFSACVAESLIVTDRWQYLKEHSDIVQDCWVESVFDYAESPRNLVVVGVKR